MSDQTNALTETDIAQLRDLLDRAGFEAGDAAQMGADTFAPSTGERIAPDGTVTYDFEGHLHAQGLDIDVLPADIAGLTRIKWIRQSDGAAVASMAGIEDTAAGVDEVLMAASVPEVPARTSVIYLRARRDADLADLLLVTRDEAGPARQVTLLDSKGHSQFLLADVRWGRVEGLTGGKLSGSSGWSSSRNAAGDYNLNFSPAFPDIPSVFLTAESGRGGGAVLNGTPSTTFAPVNTFLTNTGALSASHFDFIAVAHVNTILGPW